MRPVLVKWLDSRQPLSGWQHLEDIDPPLACECMTVGFVVHEDAEIVTLAQSVGDIGRDTAQACGLMTIPVRCVTSREAL